MPANGTPCNSKNGCRNHGPAHPPVSLDKFLAEMGLSPVSGWRFRQRGWLKTVNIAGRHYVPHDAIVEFNARAAAGEFSRQLSNPKANAKSECGAGKSAKPSRDQRTED